MTSPPSQKKCGGSSPCKGLQECCLPPTQPINNKPTNVSTTSMFSPLFLGHWYFWLAVTATIVGILCACSLWKKHSQSGWCCKDSGRDERTSEPDSNGSCYVPPHYSRCNSFYQAPPPYSEVTSKPDLYPLVISYNGDSVVKTNNGSTGYIMVQYFKNFIARPVGSLSATSTTDSLSSSFICNAANEANTIIPPPYSRMGSLEDVTAPGVHLPQSTSTENQVQPPPSVHSNLNNVPTTSTSVPKLEKASVIDNPLERAANKTKCQFSCDGSPLKVNKKVCSLATKERSQDSESQEEEHNFSDLLNLSVCAPHVHSGAVPHMFSVANSMTSSDISSLANLGTPDSPPRATSPTVEMRELLDKIQQLPQQRSPVPDVQRSKLHFHKSKSKTLYMPLNDGPKKMVFGKGAKNWLSRSAPTTPCEIFAPNFPAAKKMGSQRNSKGDGMPLLHENQFL